MSQWSGKPSPACCGIRLFLDRHTTAADVDWTALVLRQVLQRTLARLPVSAV